MHALVLIFMITAAVGCNEQTASVADSGSAAVEKRESFDAARAYRHLTRMVEIGPRPSGSQAIRTAQDYILSELKTYGLKTVEDSFTARTPLGPISMKNLIAELPGNESDVVIISGHYDSKRQDGFVGANDGGSSTAAVLEMARVLSKSNPDYTLWFVFFDGEEAVVDWNANGGKDNTYGSRHMVARLKDEGNIEKIKALILLDMIGDRNLDIARDYESTPWLIDLIWRTARELGHGKHFLGNEGAYLDDHIPFKEAGVPVIDIIDFNYGPGNSYWHTADDNLDKVSGESMKIVGDVVIGSLPALFKELKLREAPLGQPSHR